MSDFCREVQGDGKVTALCQFLADQYHLTKEQLDQGVPHVVRRPGSDPYLQAGASDGAVEPAEIYAASIAIAEREEDEDRLRFSHASRFAKKHFRFTEGMLSLLRREAGLRIPWLFDDRHQDRRAEAFFTAVQSKVDSMKGWAAAGTREPGSVEYKRALANEIFSFIQRPRKRGGMGVAFDEKQDGQGRSLQEMVSAGKATCLEFVILFRAIARQAGLEALPVEVYTNRKGELIDHVSIGVPLGNDETAFFDLKEGAGMGVRQRWSFMTAADLIAYDLNTRALPNIRGEPHEQAYRKMELLLQALDLSPHSYMVLYNLGYLSAMGFNNLQSSLEYFLKARDEYPDYPDTHHNLAAIYQRLGRTADTVAECRIFQDLTGSPECRR